jgi:pimeloyl-ACP methyl ester carboxylesterase
MKVESRHNYVLIAGAWHEVRIWRDVAAGLREMDHVVTTPTLSGLGERGHIGRDADLDTHAEDVVAHVGMERLDSITLVGWSYRGMIATGVLASIPDKIKAMIYLDAFVLENGKALVDYVPAESVNDRNGFMEKDTPIPSPPLRFSG